MPRKASTTPWFHAASGKFCATVGGKRHYLDSDPKIASQKLKKLLALEKSGLGKSGRDWLDASLLELINEFLDDIRSRRSEGTYRNCKERLYRALKIIGTDIRVGQIRRLHLAKIEQAMVKNYSPSTVRDTLAALQQVFNFAVANDLLDYSPLVGYRKPAGRNRTRVVTPDEFQALLRVADPCFRRLMFSMRLTGCRPGELRSLTWDMVDLEKGFWTFPQHKTITMQRDPLPRVIPLPPTIWNLCRWLKQRRNRSGNHVFLNLKGEPYKKDTLVHKMKRYRTAARIETKAGENLVLYCNRHAFATSAVGKVSDMELAALMGHTTTRTLRRYVHLNSDHLREIQKRLG